MAKRNLGGRGQKAEYETSVVRVPDPIKDEVLRLVSKFHDKREGVAISQGLVGLSPIAAPIKTNPVPQQKKYWQIPASIVSEWVRSIEPLPGDDDSPAAECFGISKDCWYVDEETEQYWYEFAVPKIRVYLALSDQVNLCIWQFDNTVYCPSFASSELYRTVCNILGKLVDYDLIAMDSDVEPCSIKDAIAFINDLTFHGMWKRRIGSPLNIANQSGSFFVFRGFLK